MGTKGEKEEGMYAEQEGSAYPKHIAEKLSELLQAGIQLCASGGGCDGYCAGRRV